MSKIDRRRFLKAIGAVSLVGACPLVSIVTAREGEATFGVTQSVDLGSARISVLLFGTDLTDHFFRSLHKVDNVTVYRAARHCKNAGFSFQVVSIGTEPVNHGWAEPTDFWIATSDMVVMVGNQGEPAVAESMEIYGAIIQQFGTDLIVLDPVPLFATVGLENVSRRAVV